jgi:hypothetical protein
MAVGFEQSEYEIPQSRGMPPVVRYLFAVGLVVIFFMGFLAVRYSGDFHVWPSWDTIKVPLAGHF